MLHIKVNTLTHAKRDLVDTLTRSLAMELSGESNVETMRGNEISTTIKSTGIYRLFDRTEREQRETTKIQTSQKKQRGETTHSECLKLKHESRYLGNREEFYWRNVVGSRECNKQNAQRYCPKAEDGKKMLAPNPLDNLLTFATNKYERALRREAGLRFLSNLYISFC